MCYWGYRFETVATLSQHPSKVKLSDVPQQRYHSDVNTHVQYCSVVRTKLGKHSIIMGGEVDCTTDDKIPNDETRNYVELKVNRVVQNERHVHNFQKKLMKTFMQCFLIGIPKGEETNGVTNGFSSDNWISG